MGRRRHRRQWWFGPATIGDFDKNSSFLFNIHFDRFLPLSLSLSCSPFPLPLTHTHRIRRCESHVENKVITIYNVVWYCFRSLRKYAYCITQVVQAKKKKQQQQQAPTNKWVSRFFRSHQQKVLFDLWLWFSVSRALRFVYGQQQTPSTTNRTLKTHPSTMADPFRKYGDDCVSWLKLRFTQTWEFCIRTHVLLNLWILSYHVGRLHNHFRISSRVILQSDILIWFRMKIIIDFQ